LPTAASAGEGKMIYFTGNNYTITINTSGGDIIRDYDGSTTSSLGGYYFVILISDGSGTWYALYQTS